MNSILVILLYFIGIASFIVFKYIQINSILSGILAFLVLLASSSIAGYVINRRYLKSLDWDCDPEKFLQMLKRQEKKSRKNERRLNHLAINQAAGYITLGKFKTAKEYLDGIDISYLSEKNGTLLTYSLNKILCHYELGEMDKGEALYETNLVRLNTFDKGLKQAIDILVGERYFYLKRYEESYIHLSKMLKVELNKRQYLCVLYRLAQMDIMNGDIDKAMKRLDKIIRLGNKLWIVNASKELVESMQQREY
ncbi:MAG: hypothetical protein K0S61_1798 [Anaerocolumna sp.]|nr:hypothetical protein [Anaerocolumna sp.]